MRHQVIKCPIHIILAIKGRRPLISEGMESRLYGYIGGICKNLDCTPIRVGGHRDHVHILCHLSQHVSVVRLVTDIKQYSMQWLKKMDKKYKDFHWQEGFGAFAVDVAEADIVGHYIAAQKQHHYEKTFEEEWKHILANHGIPGEEEVSDVADCDVSVLDP